MSKYFENLIILGRPGSGKSEIVDLLRKTPLPKRMLQFKIRNITEIDDFVWLYEKLKEDDIWEETIGQRKFSKKVEDGYLITNSNLWDFCLECINAEYEKGVKSDSDFYDKNTLFIEFSRGCEKTYKDALGILSDDILKKSSILHLDITYEEALKRNEIRYKKGKEDTTLHHKVPLEQMDKSYKTSDWEKLSGGKESGFLIIKDIKVPFINLKNQPAPENNTELEKRTIKSLFQLYKLKYKEKSETLISGISDSFDMIEDYGSGAFDHLFVLGRPASGKSEFIDFIKKTDVAQRIELFHIAELEELDDYMILAGKFKEDNIWERLLGKGMYSTRDGGGHLVDDLDLFRFGINQINKALVNRYIPNEDFYKDHTMFIEFARGCDLGYQVTLDQFHPDVFKRAAIFFIDCSFEECWRRNVARYEAKKKYSVLAHLVPRSEMEKLYFTHDWTDMTKGEQAGYIKLKDVTVPFVTMDNEKELKDPTALTKRYKQSLDVLIEKYRNLRRTK